MIRTLSLQLGDTIEVHAARKVDTPARWVLFCNGDVDARMIPGWHGEAQITYGSCREGLGLPSLTEAANPPIGFNVE